MDDILTRKFTAFIPSSEQETSVRIFDTKVPFQSPFSSSITLGLPRDIIWPVYVYTFSAPIIKTNNNLNILEKLILKVLTIRKYISPLELSEIICIPEDLTKFIIERLKDKGIINNKYEIIKQIEENTESSIDCCIFQEYFTGEFFPYIKELNNDVFLGSKVFHEENKRDWSISANKPNKIKVTSTEIVSIVKQMVNKYRSSFSQEYNYNNIKNLEKKSVDLYPSDPQLFYLYSQIAIDIDSNKYFHIADPFGGGYSQILENAFEYKNDFKKWFVIQTQNQMKQSETDKGKTKKNYINKNYIFVEKNITPQENRKYCTIGQIYSALEWTLYYFCRYSKELIRAVTKLNNITDCDKSLKNILKEIGFNIQKDLCFTKFADNKINSILINGSNPTLFPLLEIALVVSSYDDDCFKKMQKLTKTEKNFIKRIFELHSDRGNHEHGSGEYYGNKDIELTDEKFCKNVIEVLLPDYKFYNVNNVEDNENRTEKENDKQKEIDAFNSIFEKFSSSYYKLDYGLQDRLIDCEKNFLYYRKCKIEKDINIRYFATLIAAICQNILFNFICNMPIYNITAYECKSKVENKIKNLEFIGQEEKLPDALSKVKDILIRQSINRENSSLGANLIVFLAIAEKELLLNIKEKEKDFISIISKILEYRGHGVSSEPKYISMEEFINFRENVYKIIKILLGE